MWLCTQHPTSTMSRMRSLSFATSDALLRSEWIRGFELHGLELYASLLLQVPSLSPSRGRQKSCLDVLILVTQCVCNHHSSESNMFTTTHHVVIKELPLSHATLPHTQSAWKHTQPTHTFASPRVTAALCARSVEELLPGHKHSVAIAATRPPCRCRLRSSSARMTLRRSEPIGRSALRILNATMLCR